MTTRTSLHDTVRAYQTLIEVATPAVLTCLSRHGVDLGPHDSIEFGLDIFGNIAADDPSLDDRLLCVEVFRLSSMRSEEHSVCIGDLLQEMSIR